MVVIVIAVLVPVILLLMTLALDAFENLLFPPSPARPPESPPEDLDNAH